jgi:hypothetical protein
MKMLRAHWKPWNSIYDLSMVRKSKLFCGAVPWLWISCMLNSLVGAVDKHAFPLAGEQAFF